ncbi:Rv3654c family TadE-like protein [Nocardioides sp.]|uniref:Rv3654c family TadE-like protein n=1 Tax=Nocardioides sp. TaxID=35761 RepID=UPI002C023172|nr:Rv3654c family TadE-like protein [Nocardioides sp.]HXH81123.1 Rv3654c family TadE-like protein [Nocardioides sp.]
MRGRTIPGGRQGEVGSATILVLAVTGLLMFVGLALSGVTAIVLAHRSAQAAADLAALAAASAAAVGLDACAAADRSAEANDASLASCHQAGGVVTVAVRVSGPRLLDRDYDVTAQARAGPAGWASPVP